MGIVAVGTIALSWMSGWSLPILIIGLLIAASSGMTKWISYVVRSSPRFQAQRFPGCPAAQEALGRVGDQKQVRVSRFKRHLHQVDPQGRKELGFIHQDEVVLGKFNLLFIEML